MSKFTKHPAFKPFIVRPIQEGDEADVYRLLRGDESELSQDDLRHPKHETQRLIEASKNPDPPGLGWIAVSEGKGVGIITTKEGFSGGVFVDENYRGMRIADKLVLEREAFMIAHGQTEAHVDIKAGNAPSLKLFTRLGYTFDDGSKGDPGLKDPETLLHLTKALAEKPAAAVTARPKPAAMKGP